MIITGSTLLIEAGSIDTVLERLRGFPEVTFHVQSEDGTELVVNLEAEDSAALERLCQTLKDRIPDIIDISHIYVNFEEEIAKIVS